VPLLAKNGADWTLFSGFNSVLCPTSLVKTVQARPAPFCVIILSHITKSFFLKLFFLFQKKTLSLNQIQKKYYHEQI